METTVQSAPHQVKDKENGRPLDKENTPSYDGREPGEVLSSIKDPNLALSLDQLTETGRG
jgi:hypothetical protein